MQRCSYAQGSQTVCIEFRFCDSRVFADLKGGQIIIRRLKGSLHTVQQLMPHRGEPLLDELKALREYFAMREANAGDALFVSQKGGHLSSTQVYRIYRDIAC
jgi:hypothetical protein